MKSDYKVIDFFCGAGGFSEGFRQQGFSVIKGVDFWQVAIDSHNLNHHLTDSVKNIIDFWGESSIDVADALSLPDAEVLIGSPSCVSFSMSNKAGKADKTDGIKLIESFLRVVAVHKNKPNSILKAWYMENVPESKAHIKEEYSFESLNLSMWARSIGKKPNEIALVARGEVLNASDYGAPQSRKRYIVGEWTETGEFLIPKKTTLKAVTSKAIRSKMPPPTLKLGDSTADASWTDPNYPNLVLKTIELSDHFYDTGLYKIEWEKAEHLKVNHPFMGKMSFPENEERGCRTIMATRSASTREALIYKSEYNRLGNGEYRLPTIREIATLMGYPYCYQFIGTESQKWKQIGNSVSPYLSAALAKAIRLKANLNPIDAPSFNGFMGLINEVKNLNTFEEKSFDNPKRRIMNSRFRRHPLKTGNMTVDLLNYHPIVDGAVGENWYVAAFAGTGINHKVKIFEKEDIFKVERILKDYLPEFNEFKKNVLDWKVSKNNSQAIYEQDLNLENTDNPINKVKEINEIINSFTGGNLDFSVDVQNLFPKNTVPIYHLMASYALHKLT
jgi:DNA (cytosine-5)-methyltransferase 1